LTLRHRPQKRKVALLEWKEKGVYRQIMKAINLLTEHPCYFFFLALNRFSYCRKGMLTIDFE